MPKYKTTKRSVGRKMRKVKEIWVIIKYEKKTRQISHSFYFCCSQPILIRRRVENQYFSCFPLMKTSRKQLLLLMKRIPVILF